MPINIYNQGSNERLEWLCESVWDLPNQIDTLEKWLATEGIKLTKDSYVADIGFDIRKEATGGGAVLTAKSIKIMGDIGMDIFFSEYPAPLSE
jgi:hypothetical protein